MNKTILLALVSGFAFLVSGSLLADPNTSTGQSGSSRSGFWITGTTTPPVPALNLSLLSGSTYVTALNTSGYLPLFIDGSTITLNSNSGGQITIAGPLAGTPSGGTLDLTAVTLTLPTVDTLAASDGSGNTISISGPDITLANAGGGAINLGINSGQTGSYSLIVPVMTGNDTIALASQLISTPVSIANGGTASSTAAAAVTALGAQPKITHGVVTTTEVTTSMNSTTMVNSTSAHVSLSAGTWIVTMRWIVGDANVGTAGSGCNFVFSGTATETCMDDADSLGFGTADPPNSYGALNETSYALFTSPTNFYMPGNAIYRRRTSLFIVTGSGTLTLQSAQQTATASNHKLYAGSGIIAIPQ